MALGCFDARPIPKDVHHRELVVLPKREWIVTKRVKSLIVISSASVASLTVPAFAQNNAAKSSGTWENPAIWTLGTVPGSSNSVYIGATVPAGAVSTAAVTLTAPESAANVYVGYGSPTSGTLNLGANKLTVSGTITVGDFSGTGTISEAGGSFTAGTLAMFTSGTSFSFGTADAVSGIDIETGSTLTTAATGNITAGGSVASATLNLGANANLTSGLNVEDTGATLNLAGNNLTTSGTLWLGYFRASAVGLNRGSGTPGTLTVSNLDLGNSQNLPLIAGDAITNIDIENGSTLTTAATGNITSGGSIVSGATLNLGANASLSGGLNVEGSGSTLNLAAHNLTTTNTLWLGYFQSSAVSLNRGSGTPGTLTVSNLDLGNSQNLPLIAGDTITSFDIETGSTLTTAATGNITSGGSIVSGATLNLGANASLSGGLNVEGSGSTLKLAGHNLTTTNTLWLGYFQSSAVNVVRGGTPGTLTVTNLDLGNSQNLALVAGDTITNIDIENGSTLTTAATGNITSGGNVVSSTLNLGADASMSPSGGLNVESAGSTLNLAGHNLSIGTLWLGYFSNSAVTFQRGTGTAGTLTLGNLDLANGQNLALVAGDTTTSIDIENGATLTTAGTGNITTGGNVVGATLTLGAAMNLSGGLNVQGSGATLNLANHSLTANSLSLGYQGSSSVTLQRGGTSGTLNLDTLNLANGQNVTLIAGDTITGGGINGVGGTGDINLYGGSTLTTATSTNVTCTVIVVSSTLNLGADMFIGNQLVNVENGGNLNLNNHTLTGSLVALGYDGTSTVTFNRGGSQGNLAIGNLYIGNGQNLTLTSADTVNSGDLGVTVADGATLTTAATANITNNAVNILTGGKLKLGAPLNVTGLTITNGTLDIANNHVLINYGSGPDPIAAISQYLANGFNGGSWNGSTGVVASASLVTGGATYGIGYADSADPGNPATLSSGTIEIKYTLLGDANLDGTVNGVDFGILAANFNKGVTRWDQGDFNYDNAVNGVDFGYLAANFNKGASGAADGPSALSDPALVAFAQANGLMADVPEPASTALLAIFVGGLLGRRHRRHAARQRDRADVELSAHRSETAPNPAGFLS
jgi:hypothetical protein